MSPALQSELAIDPGLVEAAGTITRSGKFRSSGATGTKPIRSGSYVLVSSLRQNGQDFTDQQDLQAGEHVTDELDVDSSLQAKKKRRGRPRKSQDGAEPDESLATPSRKRKSKKAAAADGDDDGNQGDEQQSRPRKRSKKAVVTDATENITTEDAAIPAAEPASGDLLDGLAAYADATEEVTHEDFPVSGPLIKPEQRILDSLMEEFRARHNMEQRDVNELIQSTDRTQSENTKKLWALLYKALPQRTHVSVMRAARRRYHNYHARGKWTAADDDLLKQAQVSHPGRWVEIGKQLGRMPEDCRDRWRNYLACGDKRKIDDWKPAEEARLKEVVQECMATARQAAKDRAKEQGHAFREQDWINLVNFNTVSEKMDHTRSRLQCYTHWRVMQRRDGADTPEPRTTASDESKKPARTGRSLAKYAKMTAADKVLILRQIAESNHTEESDINWKAINRQNKDSPWSTRDRKEAFGKMKELVPPQETLHGTIEAICEYLINNNPTEFDLGPEDSNAARMLLQRAIDAHTTASPEAPQTTETDPAGSQSATETALEHDIQDLNVEAARALQGIAQLSQERGEFVDRQARRHAGLLSAIF